MLQLFEFLDGWFVFLSILWVVVATPLSIAIYNDRGRRGVSLFLISITVCLLGVFAHDVYACSNNWRCWVPWCDYYLPSFGSSSNVNDVLDEKPYSATGMIFKVVHVRRGYYGVCVTIPGLRRRNHDGKREIGIKCRFVDAGGNVIYRCDSENAPVHFVSSDNRDYWESFCIYEVNRDIPFDAPVTVEVEVTGEALDYEKNYPTARFSVQRVYWRTSDRR